MDTSAASTSTSASRSTITMDTSATSTSTSANPNSNYDYAIFINHRGPDTKKNFASHLYHRLVLHGFHVFLDQKELQQGDNFNSQIIAAIESASVHVAIFSPRYAESPWCLEELRLMLKTSAPIIPVFYNVEPSELRWAGGQNGRYAQALHNHEEKRRYDSATLENWRDALSRVADKSGFELKAFNGDEGELLEKVVECVLKKVKRVGLSVAKYPTGLDMKVKDFENTVLFHQQRGGKPQIFGIVGLGGVGKTTLSKELFNRYNSDYRSSCFLPDVRDCASRGSLNLLQSKLLKELSRLDKVIDNIHEGMQMLKKPLSSSQALIILDDVDDVNQVDTLLPHVETVVRSDSLILITSRDIAVLRGAGVQEASIYKLHGLNEQHSRELFCSHAFRQTRALPGFESLVDKFIEACHGLPLSLKVFGALLYGKPDQSDWQNQLDSLQQILPSEIQRILKISYDSLNEEEKQIFLDIACLLIGENRDMAIRIWNGFGWKGLLGFQNLHNKCLVELDSQNNMAMHDHLRDMGRNIANDSNLQLPRRVRCSTVQDIDDLLQQSYNEQVLTAVRGIMVARPRRNYYGLYYRSFSLDPGKVTYGHSKMSWFKRRSHELLRMKLRNSLCNTRHRFLGAGLLDVADGDLERILRRVQSPNVIWLRWFNCPYTFLPSWVPMKNLTVLEVSGEVLETLWHGESQVPLKLRELQIYAPLSNIPKSIGRLKHLERIVLCVPSIHIRTDIPTFNQAGRLGELRALGQSLITGSYKRIKDWRSQDVLETLPEEFCRLQSLKVLELTGCSNLKSLPDSFGDLINLQYLHFSVDRISDWFPYASGILKSLPISFGNLVNLEYLDLSGHVNLKRLPNSFGNLIRLKYLNLYNCMSLTISAETLGNIRSLEHLDLTRCFKTEVLPPQVAHQRSLAELRFSCTDMGEWPSTSGDLSDLEFLSIQNSELRFLPASLCELKNLKKLELLGCENLEYMPDSVGLLTQLTELVLYGCPLRELPFKMVEGERQTSADSSFEEFMPPQSERSFGEGVYPNLHRLKIQRCQHLIEIGTLPNTLRELILVDCTKLKKIKGLSALVKLQRLRINGCMLEALPCIEHCISLKSLYISRCRKLQLGEEVVEQLVQRGCSVNIS